MGAFTFLAQVTVVVTQVSQAQITQLAGTKFARHVVTRVRRAVAALIAHFIGTTSATVMVSSTEQARVDKENPCNQIHQPTHQMLQSYITIELYEVCT